MNFTREESDIGRHHSLPSIVLMFGCAKPNLRSQDCGSRGGFRKEFLKADFVMEFE